MEFIISFTSVLALAEYTSLELWKQSPKSFSVGLHSLVDLESTKSGNSSRPIKLGEIHSIVDRKPGIQNKS